MYAELDDIYRTLSPATADRFIVELNRAARDDADGTISFLREKVNDEASFIQNLYRGGLSEEQKNELTIKVRLLAAYLLMTEKEKENGFAGKFLLLLEGLSILSPRSALALADKAADTLCGKTGPLGYSWNDLSASFSPDIMAYKIIRVGNRHHTDARMSLTKNGVTDVSRDAIRVIPYPAPEADAVTCSLSILSGKLGLWTRDSRDSRLKVSEAHSIKSIEAFVNSFCSDQKTCPQIQEGLRRYREGDSMNLLVTGFDDNGYIQVRTIDPSYQEVSGLIEDNDLVVGLGVCDLSPYIAVGSCLVGAVLEEYDGDTAFFSIYGSYMDYAWKQANYCRKNSMLIPSKALHKYGTKINWIGANGVGMITDDVPSVAVGDERLLTVLSVKDNSSGMYVNASVAGKCADVPGMEFDPGKVLKFITKDYMYLRKNYSQAATAQKEEPLDASSIRSLATILLNVRNERSSIEHYRMLSVSRVLYTLVGDEDKAAFARGRAAYVKNCILFARGETIAFPEKDVEYFEEDRRKILSTLLCLGHQEREGALCSLLETLPSGSVLSKVARLILAKNTALLAENDLGMSDAALRREIAGILEVSDVVLDEDCSDIPTGKYGNTERQYREFKSSYVFRNDDSGADFQRQGRDEVFQAVCALLNTDGGQVYIGVNNNGDPILDSNWGISADIRWLQDNYVKVNGLRREALGHNVPKVKDIDSFVNFLCDEKRIYFRETLLDNIIIEPTEDMDAVCITVSPSRFEIAYLYEDASHSVGQAFRRDGNRTIPMTEIEKQKRLMKLQSIGKEVEFQIKIQEAIDQRKKIILRDYAASEVRDRFLAPINLLYGGESVWCVDLQDPDKTCKQFRLSRARDVEVKDETYPHGKSPVESDIFRFTGEKKIHVKLSLDIRAKNYLVEEYPEAARLGADELYQSGDRWILDTKVSNVIGVRRFFIGLADKVEILETEDSEAIKRNVREFLEESVAPSLEFATLQRP